MGIDKLLLSFLDVYSFLVILWIILSWLYVFNIVSRESDIIRVLNNFLDVVVDVPLSKIRSVVPIIGGIDISPIILLIGIQILKSLLI